MLQNFISKLEKKLPARAVGLSLVGLFAALLIGGVRESISDNTNVGDESPRLVLGRGAGGTAFVDNAVCAGCHEAQFAEWKTSHHAHSMARATPATVRGNFDNVRFDHAGKRARFFRRDDRYFVELEGLDSVREFEVSYTFGYDPLQQYLVELPGGRLQALTIAWDVKAKRWFDLLPDESPKPGASRHWTGRLHNWNSRCAECHSTNLQKNYSAKSDTFQTRFSAVNVSCQACHGPGGAHVAWAKGPREEKSDNGLVVKADAAGAHIEVCARCHSRRHRLTMNDQHDRSFFDQFSPLTLKPGFYHPDGQMDDEVFVFGSFLQSKMHQAGVQCSDCHNAHTGGVLSEGNALCTRCHNDQPPKRFQSLKPKNYDTAAHHHHKPGTSGAQCVSCHMPAKTYMMIDPRRDHKFSIPRPDLSDALGTPNACIGCHTDKTNAWAKAQVNAWYGEEQTPTPHFGEAIAAGRRLAPQALPALASLAGDRNAAGIIRATAVELLGAYGPAAAQPLIKALKDENHLVRASAVESLTQLPPEAKVSLFSGLLADPSRLVRMIAARELAKVPRGQIPNEYHEALDAGLNEYIEAQEAAAETPEAQLNLANLYTDQSQKQRAADAYERALKLAPNYGRASIQFAAHLSAIGNNKRAEAVLREAIKRNPDYADGYYALGLLLAETKRLQQAEKMLAKAGAVNPGHAAALYSHGLVLMHLNRPAEAEVVLQKAHKASPGTPAALEALVILLMREKRLADAEKRARELVSTFPEYSRGKQLLKRIKEIRKAG